MRLLLSSLMRDRRGATAIEYGLIVSLVVIAMIGALAALGVSVSDMWGEVSSEFVNAS